MESPMLHPILIMFGANGLKKIQAELGKQEKWQTKTTALLSLYETNSGINNMAEWGAIKLFLQSIGQPSVLLLNLSNSTSPLHPTRNYQILL